MPYEIDTAADHYDLLDRVRKFACGFGVIGTISYSGTGDGTLDALEAPTSPTETWTITCTDATTPGAEVWSVSGSVSGAQADATTGTDYDNGIVACHITAGATDFAVNDAWTVPVTEGALRTAGEEWQVLRWDTSTANHELILKGLGLSRTEEIYIGIQTYQSVAADYYNWKVAAFDGYVAANDFDHQPGNCPNLGVPSWNQSMPYWLLVNGQRIALATKVSTVFESLYLGKFLPYATPNQYPNPIIAAGMLTSASATRWSSTGYSMPYWGDSWHGNPGNLRMRWLDGAWKTPRVWPWGNESQDLMGDAPKGPAEVRDTGGEWPLLPAVVFDDNNVIGKLDGVFHVTGFGNGAENVVQNNGTDYVVIQDVFRTGFNNYYAMEQS